MATNVGENMRKMGQGEEILIAPLMSSKPSQREKRTPEIRDTDIPGKPLTTKNTT